MQRRIKLVTRSAAAPVPDRSPVKLSGMGPKWLQPLYLRWFSEFHKLHPEVEFNYQFFGNVPPGLGLRTGALDFAVTDVPFSNDLHSQTKTRAAITH